MSECLKNMHRTTTNYLYTWYLATNDRNDLLDTISENSIDTNNYEGCRKYRELRDNSRIIILRNLKKYRIVQISGDML